jgi:hypothetical protein
MIADCKWQWMDATYGPMGWFTDEEKRQHENTPEFANGEWRVIPAEEVASMNRCIAQLAYEQS